MTVVGAVRSLDRLYCQRILVYTLYLFSLTLHPRLDNVEGVDDQRGHGTGSQAGNGLDERRRDGRDARMVVVAAAGHQSRKRRLVGRRLRLSPGIVVDGRRERG